MTDDWAPGDKALCVKQLYNGWGEPAAIKVGSMHIVAGTQMMFCFGCMEPHLALLFAPYPGQRFAADFFIKLRDHEPDAEDEETIRLLKGEPVEPVTTYDWDKIAAALLRQRNQGDD